MLADTSRAIVPTHPEHNVHLGKRPCETQELSPQKKINLTNHICDLTDLPHTALSRVFTYLSRKDRLPVMGLSTAMLTTMEGYWKEAKQREKIDFYWSDAPQPYKERISYCLTKALTTFVSQIRCDNSSQYLIWERFSHIAKLSPALNAYLLDLLATKEHPQGQVANLEVRDALHHSAIVGRAGGEVILKILWDLKEATLDEVLLSKAMAHKAFCVGLLVVKLFGYMSSKHTCLTKIALACAEAGDLSSLEELLARQRELAVPLYLKEYRFSPILFYRALFHGDKPEQESLFEQVLKDKEYSSLLGPKHYAQMVHNKVKLAKYAEADALLLRHKATVTYLPTSVLEVLANKHIQESHWVRASQLYAQLVEIYPKSVPIELLANIACAYDHLENAQLALPLFQRVLAKCPANKGPWGLFWAAARAYLDCNKLEDASKLLQKARWTASQKYGEQLPLPVATALTALSKALVLEENALVEEMLLTIDEDDDLTSSGEHDQEERLN